MRRCSSEFFDRMRANADLQVATPIDRVRWEARGVIDRVTEQMARLLRYWL